MLDSGIKSIAVVFKHAAIFPDHEEAVGSVARELGFQQVHNCSNKTPFYAHGSAVHHAAGDLKRNEG